MGKGARIRRERAAKEASRTPPRATHVDPPSVARERRRRGRRAFKEFMKLPRDQRRPWENETPTENTDTTKENHG
jgi:hypothetical protein